MIKNKYQPSLISWNLTSTCNLKCPHCYLDAGGKTGTELTTDESFNLIDEMSALGTEMLILTGGEPLLRKDTFSISQYATQKGILVVMGTNGVMLDESMVTTLRESGVRGVGISLDSLYPLKHDIFRGLSGSWQKTIHGMRNCVKQGLPVILQTTVTDWNLEEIPDLIRFASEESAQAFNLYYLVCTGRGEKLTDITPQQYEDSFTSLIQAQTEYPGMMVRAKCAPQINRLAVQNGLPFLNSAGCPAGTGYLRVSPGGDITPCPYLPLVVGNIRGESLKRIWEESVIFKELREPRLRGRCGVCEFGEVCIGCRARASAINGDYLAEDPWCEYQPGNGGKPDITEIAWSSEAEERLKRLPSFIRGRVKLSIEGYARAKGLDSVTVSLMDEVRSTIGNRF